MHKPLALTQMPLERCTTERKNEKWLASQYQHPEVTYYACYRGQLLIKDGDLAQLSLLTVKALQSEKITKIFLGKNAENHSPIFMIDFSRMSKAHWQQALDNILVSFIDNQIELRAALSELPAGSAAIAGFGHALVNWHRSHQYCGYCGAKLQDREGGHAKQCSHIDCAKMVFPRTDPVVIMIVDYTDEHGQCHCLLAGHQRSQGKVISTLAGFVDPGESIEETVAREVFEEVGLEAISINYLRSQPWPFPASLMLGFHVSVASNQVTIDPDEITHVKWCSAQDISNFDDWGTNEGNIEIPGKHSISRYLIDWWCQQQLIKQ